MQFRFSQNAKFTSVFFLVALLLASTPAVLAQSLSTRYWTTVGSAGTVDEADKDKVVFSGGTVAFPGLILPPGSVVTADTDAGRAASSSAAGQGQIALPTTTTTATIRYNVVAVDGLFNATRAVGMRLRFRDDGARAQVVARLIEHNINTGVETTRLTFDSNTFAAANGYQVQATGEFHPAWSFDFDQKAYYVEVTLTRISGTTIFNTGNPGLAIIQINTAPWLI